MRTAHTGSSTRHQPSSITSAFLASLLLAAIAAPASAQGAREPDVRWQAWLGCWTQALAGPETRVVGVLPQSHTVCIVPASSTSSVDIVTISNGAIADRRNVDADGAQHPGLKDGCTGWESAQWSVGKRRLFLRSEYTCPGGLARSSSGVLAITGGGQWIDVEGISSGGNKGVRVARYLDAGEPGSVPAEVRDLLRGRAMALSAARVSAGASLNIEDIVEATHRLDNNVVEAWLVEFNAGATSRPSPLNASQLTALDDAGVAPNVIDMVVALAYPRLFTLNPATGEGNLRVGEGGRGEVAQGMSKVPPILGYDAYGFPIYGSEAMMRDACSANGYSSFYSSYGCSPYYGAARGCYSPYGSYGYGGYYGGYYGYTGYSGGYNNYSGYGCNGYNAGYGWYPGGGSVIVVVRGSDTGGVDAQPHGKVVKGHGYTQGTSSGSGSSSGSSGASTSTSGSSSAGSSGSSTGTSSGSSGRTAVPKKP